MHHARLPLGTKPRCRRSEICFAVTSAAAAAAANGVVLFALLFHGQGRGKTVNVFICNQTALDLTASLMIVFKLSAIIAGVTTHASTNGEFYLPRFRLHCLLQRNPSPNQCEIGVSLISRRCSRGWRRCLISHWIRNIHGLRTANFVPRSVCCSKATPLCRLPHTPALLGYW